MQGGGNHTKRYLRLFLIATVLVGIGAVITVFMEYRRLTGNPEEILSDVAPNAELTIRNLKHTATREGFTEWRLNAEEAQYRGDERIAQLRGLSVTFFLQDDEEVHLSAERGQLDTKTNNLIIEGNIRIRQGPLLMTTEQLRYGHQDRIIRTESPVEVSGEKVRLTADRMKYEILNRRILFEGHVHGTLHGNISI